MKKLIALFILALLSGVIGWRTAPAADTSPVAENRVCFQGRCFLVEVAETVTERMRGLQYREHLEPERGMLFVFENPGRHRFWMKNTLIPLDMIWLDPQGVVVHIEARVPPCRTDPCPIYFSPKKALYVLELNAGQAEKFSLGIGDKMDVRLEED